MCYSILLRIFKWFKIVGKAAKCKIIKKKNYLMLRLDLEANLNLNDTCLFLLFCCYFSWIYKVLVLN